jgi:hypothetical protein
VAIRGTVVALAAACSAAVTFASTTAVFAGTNGQEVVLFVGCQANWTQIDGHNQNNQFVEQWVHTPAETPEGGCYGSGYYDPNWWWKGWVNFQGWWGYNGKHQGSQPYSGSANIDIPVYQEYDWYNVGVPS